MRVILSPLLFIGVSISSHAAVFLQLPGIEGDATAKGYEKQITVASCTWGVAADTKVPLCPQSVNIQKPFDRSSLKLAKAAALGGLLAEATLSVSSTSKSGSLDLLTLNFKNLSIKDYVISQGGDDQPFESFTLKFIEIDTKQRVVDDGKATGPKVVSEFEIGFSEVGFCPIF